MNPHLEAGERARRLDAAALRAALLASRADTLATFDAYRRKLGDGVQVPYHPELNPPRWELGHIGWFQEYWLARNSERARGAQANPEARRYAGVRDCSDALYDSSHVAHTKRWQLPLPDAATTQKELQAQLHTTLDLLAGLPNSDDALYFHRLVLFHEDMHHEAALYMAQALDVPITDARWRPPLLCTPRHSLDLPRQSWALGYQGEGFAFDNELQAQEATVPATAIDSRVLTWAEYLPFVESGEAPRLPRYLRRDGPNWMQRRHGHWRELALQEPVCHLSLAEAEAWCRWAGRRLPTEAEWECAACSLPGFEWGAVWEWTASDFAPYEGFKPHPYREYSAPWFGSRRVLRGASFGTQPRMHHRRYRNYFTPERNDIFAGFRSCAA